MPARVLSNLLGLALVASAAFAQAPSADAPAAAELEFFERKIRPLLVSRCYECHSSESKQLGGGLRLDSKSLALTGGDSGPALAPGEPEKSLLVEAVGYQGDLVQMPPSGKLPAAEIALLSEWVRRGAVMPDEASLAAAKKSAIDFEAGRQFWSFQPLRRVEPPAVQNPDWVARPLDAFVLARLDSKGLSPSPQADRRTLLRRVNFDLIGLPPTPEEAAEFVSDDSPQAYSRLVERLLASPHYGERWGRFWLDLVRYCDVPESWAKTQAQAWLYRDWVVQAMNDDLPYDQFVTQQLAADLLPDAQPRDLAALGLLGLSPTYWKELKLDQTVIKAVVAEEWEERIHTVTSTFLGLTVACARCHDHKFDPISTRDYYALAGVFASTRQVDRPLLPADEARKLTEARNRANKLQAEADKLLAKKDASPEEKQEAQRLKVEIDQLKQSTLHFDAPLAYAVEEATLHVLPDGPNRTKLEYKSGEPVDLCVQVRGNPANLGPEVPRRFLTVLSPAEPQTFTQGSGRLELAQAMTSDAAPLAARVMVNRVWKLHFGRGLVETPSNFGLQGERPSHPDLFDDLAARFIEQGWSLKWLHREILLSSTYRQSSAASAASLAAAQSIDPDNRLLWRANRRRLEIEAWRDAVLAVSGALDRTIGGASLDLNAADNRRRTLYGTIKRRELSDMLRLNDFPDPTTHSPGRETTTTPLQQLFVLNSPFMAQQAEALVRRLHTEAPGDLNARVERAYQLLYSRSATPNQLQAALDFLQPTADGPPPGDDAWKQYAQVLLASNEFLFVD